MRPAPKAGFRTATGMEVGVCHRQIQPVLRAEPPSWKVTSLRFQNGPRGLVGGRCRDGERSGWLVLDPHPGLCNSAKVAASSQGHLPTWPGSPIPGHAPSKAGLTPTRHGEGAVGSGEDTGPVLGLEGPPRLPPRGQEAARIAVTPAGHTNTTKRGQTANADRSECRRSHRPRHRGRAGGGFLTQGVSL